MVDHFMAGVNCHEVMKWVAHSQHQIIFVLGRPLLPPLAYHYHYHDGYPCRYRCHFHGYSNGHLPYHILGVCVLMCDPIGDSYRMYAQYDPMDVASVASAPALKHTLGAMLSNDQ
jgi:hypothetical protein